MSDCQTDYLVGHVGLFGVLLESEEDEKEERDDPEDEERTQGEPNPTPVTPQKRAEKAGEKRRRLRRRRRLACNVAPLVLVQLTSWPVSLLVLVEPVVQG